MASIQEQLNTLDRQLDGTLLADRNRLRKEIQKLRQATRNGADTAKWARWIAALSRRIGSAADIRRQRMEHEPAIQFDGDLPISS